MQDPYNHLRMRRNRLQEIIEAAESDLKDVPQGRLKIVRSKNRTQYYLRLDGSSDTGIYLRKEQMELVKRLAQRDYDRQVLKAAKKELRALDQLLRSVPTRRVEEQYAQLSECRKPLVVPAVKPVDVFVREWEQKEYEPKPFLEGDPVFYTAKKERVRSKSEVLIADTLNRLGIPYRYESPIWIGGKLLHPDFVVINPRTGAVFIWEHLGMLDSPAYSDRAVARVLHYQKNGYFPGKNLIISMETSRVPLNAELVETLVRQFLM